MRSDNLATLQRMVLALLLASTLGDFCCGVVELRQYTLKPGQRETLIELFDRHLLEPQEAAGMTIVGQFRDLRRPDRFVWVRGFEDMTARHAALERFYDGPVWTAHRDRANATMVDSDDVLLLKPARPDLSFELEDRDRRASAEETLVLSGIHSLTAPADAQLVLRFEERVMPELAARDIRLRGVFVTESAPNTFRLPVREGENALVWFGVMDRTRADEKLGGLSDACALDGVKPVLLELSPTSRSRLGGRFGAEIR